MLLLSPVANPETAGRDIFSGTLPEPGDHGSDPIPVPLPSIRVFTAIGELSLVSSGNPYAAIAMSHLLLLLVDAADFMAVFGRLLIIRIKLL